MVVLVSPQQSRSERDALVHKYLPLARGLAARYKHTHVPLEDLVQVASMGLVMAAGRYDPARGTSFASYAVPTILGELRRHLRDHGWAARVPRGLQEDVMRVTSARNELAGSLGRSPTPAELAAESGMSVEAVLAAIEAGGAYEAESFDHMPSAEDDPGSSLHARIGSEEQGYRLVEYGVSVRETMAELSDEERAAVRLRFVDDLTQSEIATRIGVSQMQVSRLLSRALARLRDAAGEPEAA
ncbi:MAG: SigB/SigF/SigG family RNA polymerase sigma factor [Actinomycetota bacterium]|nr:SigB/SigF/SigG family RNA polymerase sigma factor [Actinomycetota bacterium]